MEDTQNNNQAMAFNNVNTINTYTNEGESSSNIFIEKKKRGRKKNSVLSSSTSVIVDTSTSTTTSENIIVPEKKARKKRTVKPKVTSESNTSDVAAAEALSVGDDSTTTPIKKRKRRVCKNQDINSNTTSVDNSNNTDGNECDNGENVVNTDNDEHTNNANTNTTTTEEKVAKKRGRKPKGGKIITQHVNENNNTNDMPNIILHLKCSLSSIINKDSDSFEDDANNNSNVESYNSSQLTGSEINTGRVTRSVINKNDPAHKIASVVEDSNNNSILSNYTDSSMFKVYDPNISTSSSSSTGELKNLEKLNSRSEDSIFQLTYSPDINVYNSSCNTKDCANRTNNINQICIDNDRDRENDNNNDTDASNVNEREIWRKINQLKLSFHKSDICQNMGGTQRSACFWCTCEFDSPAIYIPKSCSKEGYQVYGCFCSPECAAAFLMNENIDTSTRFERYHLLNSVYGKIYKYEKSIKIAPNPYYLLNKYYGNLTIQEYRKLFHSDQMIYVVNKPLTHILPELYEDNNDFLLNTKIIPNHSVNIKKNKPLKSNILNNAFGIN